MPLGTGTAVLVRALPSRQRAVRSVDAALVWPSQ